MTDPAPKPSIAALAFAGLKEADDLDQFFRDEPVQTNWNEVLAETSNGTHLSSDQLIRLIQKYEPLAPGSTAEHAVWVLQQRLRLALRREKALEVQTAIPCSTCGQHLADPVLEQCLGCEEFYRQMPDTGGRGSCWFMQPTYHAPGRAWGLLYYWSRGSSGDAFLFWLSLGYPSHRAAWLALYPLARYANWLERKYNGVRNNYSLAEEVLDLEQLISIKASLPLSVDAFAHYLKGAIAVHMKADHSLVSYTVHNSLRDYEYEQNH